MRDGMKLILKTIAGALLVGMVGAALFAGSGLGSPNLPPCPNSQDAVTDYFPAYGRVGEGFLISLEVPQRARVANMEIATSRRGGVTIETVEPAELWTKVIINPGPAGTLGLKFRWVQDLSTPKACRGSDEYQIPVIPKGATAGDPEQPRMDGRFAVTEHALTQKGTVSHPTWTLSPTCDYFGCRTRLRSSLGLRGAFLPTKDGDYELAKSRHPGGTSGTCIVEKTTKNTLTGEVLSSKVIHIKRAFREEVRIQLNPKRVVGGEIRAFAGTIHSTYFPTAAAERRGCRKVYHYGERLSAVLKH
jgi:hypothetical protein